MVRNSALCRAGRLTGKQAVNIVEREKNRIWQSFLHVLYCYSTRVCARVYVCLYAIRHLYVNLNAKLSAEKRNHIECVYTQVILQTTQVHNCLCTECVYGETHACMHVCPMYLHTYTHTYAHTFDIILITHVIRVVKSQFIHSIYLCCGSHSTKQIKIQQRREKKKKLKF